MKRCTVVDGSCCIYFCLTTRYHDLVQVFACNPFVRLTGQCDSQRLWSRKIHSPLIFSVFLYGKNCTDKKRAFAVDWSCPEKERNWKPKSSTNLDPRGKMLEGKTKVNLKINLEKEEFVFLGSLDVGTCAENHEKARTSERKGQEWFFDILFFVQLLLSKIFVNLTLQGSAVTQNGEKEQPCGGFMAVTKVLQNNITGNVSMKKIFQTVEYLSVVEHQIWLLVNCKSVDLSKEDLPDNKFIFYDFYFSLSLLSFTVVLQLVPWQPLVDQFGSLLGSL